MKLLVDVDFSFLSHPAPTFPRVTVIEIHCWS